MTTLINLGTVFGMGLIVTTFMLAQSSATQSLGKAVLLGNIGAVFGGIVSVRAMAHFGKRKYGTGASVINVEDEGYDIQLISAALMSASGIYATYASAGNEGGLQPSGVDKVVMMYRRNLEHIQEAKKAQAAEQEG